MVNSSAANGTTKDMTHAQQLDQQSASGLNQERVTQRISRIYPINDSVYMTKSKKSPVEVKFHPFTSRFLNETRLEKLYQVTFARENSPRSLRIACMFLFFYIMFTGLSVVNLFSKDESTRDEAKSYFYVVYAPLVPIPFLLVISRKRKYEIYFQDIYSLVLLCWSASFLAGGMYSMFNEWYSYVQHDFKIVMEAIDINARDFCVVNPAEADGNFLSVVNTTYRGGEQMYYLNDTGFSDWKFAAISGNRSEVIANYTTAVLFPAASMNVNLLRPILFFTFAPLLRLDTSHFTVLSIALCIAYDVLTLIKYPDTRSSHFTQNRFSVLLFPIVFAFIMLLKNRDIDRVIRQDFLHVWAVELEAEKATREKNAIAEENRNLKKELAKRDDFQLDLTSPLYSILNELKTFIDTTPELSQDSQRQAMNILKKLSKLDTNLFTPDIGKQIRNEKEVDKDTKDWALSVLTKKEYIGTGRASTSISISSHSNSDTHKSLSEALTAPVSNLTSPLKDMPAFEDKIMQRVKQNIIEEGWNLDVFKLAEITGHRPLLYLASAMFDMHELHEEFRIDRVILQNFLFLIDDGYLANPYHNSCHAADVVNSVNYLMATLSDGHIRDSLTNLEFYAALIAAAIHDFRHPGKSNNYMIKSKHDLAIQYNDRSILESMHVAETFFVMKNPACDIFARIKDKPYREVRKAIVEMVLSTDLSMHLQLVGTLKAMVLQENARDTNLTGNNAPSSNLCSTDPMMMMKVVIKCSDIGHAAKERKLHVIWSALIIEEFFLQGDQERANESDISPFMDRYAENSAKNQVGFFEFIVLPFYETIAQVIFEEEFSFIHNIAKQNYSLWKEADKRQMTSMVTIKNEIFLNEAVQLES